MDSTPAPAGEMPDFDAMWDYGDPAATEERFQTVLRETKDTEDASYRAQLLTQIARAQGLQRRFDDAHGTLDAVDAMQVRDVPIVRVRSLLERGRVHNSSGHVDQARPLFALAWESARANSLDGSAVDAAHMMGIVEPPESALAWNERALELARSSSDPIARKWLGSLYNNIGWTYHGQGEYTKALELFEAALRFREEQGDATTIRIAKWCIARTLRSLDRVEEALAMQRELEKEIRTLDNPDGYIYEELAECLHALEREGEAVPHFHRAHELLSKDTWFVENEPERLARLAELGKVRR